MPGLLTNIFRANQPETVPRHPERGFWDQGCQSPSVSDGFE